MTARIWLAGLLLALCFNGFAQSNPFMNDANGRPLYTGTTYKSEGSPYYFDQYMPAEVTSLEGKVYKDIKVKINLVVNELSFMTAEGKEMVAVLPIKKVKFLYAAEGQDGIGRVLESYGQPINSPNTPVYEVMDTGRCTLLKLVKVTYRDSKEFNQATTVRVFQHTESFHVLWAGGKIEKLGAGKEVAALFKDKEALVRAYIETNKLKCRSAADYRKVVGYYNSLF
jgi:hypothetical protein